MNLGNVLHHLPSNRKQQSFSEQINKIATTKCKSKRKVKMLILNLKINQSVNGLGMSCFHKKE